MSVPDITQLLAALLAKLRGLSVLTTELGTFDGDPCIFMAPRIPSEANRPYIHIEMPSGFTQDDTKNSYGWSVPITMTIITEDPESIVDTMTIVDIIIANLVDVILTLSTDTHHQTDLINMTPAEVSNDLTGMRLTFSFDVSD